MDYLTIKEVSLQLGIPESTARHYRDKFEAYIQAKGQGRKRRYHSSSIDVLRYVAEASKRNETQEQIELGLSKFFTRVYDADKQTQRNNVAATQDKEISLTDLVKSQALSLDALTQAILRLALAQEERNEVLTLEVTRLRNQVCQLENLLALPASTTGQNDQGQGPTISEEPPAKKSWRKLW